MTTPMETVITLKLTVAEVNGILQTLSKLPYEQAHAIIQNIQQQAHSCLQQPDAPQPEVPPEVKE